MSEQYRISKIEKKLSNEEIEETVVELEQHFEEEIAKHPELGEFLFFIQSEIIVTRTDSSASDFLTFNEQQGELKEKIIRELKILSEKIKSFDLHVFDFKIDSIEEIKKRLQENQRKFTVNIFLNVGTILKNSEEIYQLRYLRNCVKIYFTTLSQREVYSFFDSERKAQILNGADQKPTHFFDLTKSN